MFGIESLTGVEQSFVLVGIVLLEALALYVGYGTLTRLAGPSIQRAISAE